MPTLTVKSHSGEHKVPFIAGQSLREVLDAAGLRVRSGCAGFGACGLCKVRILQGDTGPLTANEQIHIGKYMARPPRHNSGVRALPDTTGAPAIPGSTIRLACQCRPEGDVTILLITPPPKSVWRALDIDGKPFDCGVSGSTAVDRLPGDGTGTELGAAVDVGTTHISLTVHSLGTGRCLAGRTGPNPQNHWGADVMTRLVNAAEIPERAEAMRLSVTKAIGDALHDIAVCEGIDLHRVTEVTLVANTPMLALLTGRRVTQLLTSRGWNGSKDAEEHNAIPASVCDAWSIASDALVYPVPPFGGFVGSDLLAGVVAAGLTEAGVPGLLIDVGTNSEIAVWDGDRLWVTSAAGGPAFEGCGIGCGMPAEQGAVYSVRWQQGEFVFDVIGGGAAEGLCGSGLIDLVAYLVQFGTLGETGCFSRTVPATGFEVLPGPQSVVLTKKDIDILQRAKAAMAAGVEVLLAMAGLASDSLQRVCVGGAFGHTLDVRNAQAIGLLPSVDPERFELCGNTALSGCGKLLFTADRCGVVQNIREKTSVISLSQTPEFDNRFIQHLYLKPYGLTAP